MIKSKTVNTKQMKEYLLLVSGCWRVSQSTRPDYVDVGVKEYYTPPSLTPLFSVCLSLSVCCPSIFMPPPSLLPPQRIGNIQRKKEIACKHFVPFLQHFYKHQ